MNQAQLEEILRKELAGQEDSAGRGEWTLDHCIRTAHLAVAIRQLEGAAPELDSLLYTAGLFHDVAHDSVSHELHAQVGAQRTQELLAGVLPSDFLTQVTSMIAVHDDRRPDDGRDIATHFVQDADMIDHFGTLRIWATFGFAAKHSLPFAESLDHLCANQKKRMLYDSLLHFDVARKELFSRMDEEAAFLEHAYAESRGEISL